MRWTRAGFEYGVERGIVVARSTVDLAHEVESVDVGKQQLRPHDERSAGQTVVRIGRAARQLCKIIRGQIGQCPQRLKHDCVAFDERTYRQRVVITVGMLGGNLVQVVILVLQGVIELVGVGNPFTRAKFGLIGHHEQRLGFGVVDPDDLIAEQAQLDLGQIVGRLEQSSRTNSFWSDSRSLGR